ncbi:MAG: hypothetical protein J5449_04175 [Oscillospiraceae bacterium]|nr:hypothetical protein [Oscillospiraceae bacterium]
MEKTELTVSIEPDRLDVLNYFLSQENTTAQKELDRMLTELYEKKVPEQMRGYIDSKRKGASTKPKRPAAPAPRPAPVSVPGKQAEHTKEERHEQ